jgi:hypothetical protein
MQKESIYDELHHSRYDWLIKDSFGSNQTVNLNLVDQLSSKYLFKTCETDSYEYIEVNYESKYQYKFTVLTTSIVDFISMPFAIRIIGDASIISVLHSKGYQQKQFPIWGRKLSMDCYDQLPSNQNFDFTIALSDTLVNENKSVVIVRFKSTCKKFSGSLIVSYEI